MYNEINIFDCNKNLKINFEIKNLDLVFKLKNIFSQPHKASFYQLIWIEEGEAIFYIDFKKVKISKGHLIIIGINQIIEFDVNSQYKGKVILFTDTFFNQTELDTIFLQTFEIFNPSQQNQLVEWDIEEFNEIIKLINSELGLFKVNSTQKIIVQSYLRVILLKSERKLNKQAINNRDNISRTFFNLVEFFFKQHHSVKFYINQLSIGEKKLVNHVKEQTTYTPKQYIENRIILEAKRLLMYNRNLNIKEISFQLGFDEPTNFTKFFKRKTGINPNKFKESDKIR